MPDRIRVLVVDDSAFMRKALAALLERAPDITVVGTARDGREALELVERLDPDVLTMDVEMPRLNGLEALRTLMRTAPRPVIMVSSLTQEGAATTVEALAAGAVDFLPKEHARVSLGLLQQGDELHQKVRAAAASRPALLRRLHRRPTGPRPAAPMGPASAPPELVVVGVSTGGPFALQEVLPALPADFPAPIAIVQHMPPHFTRSLAERLDALCALEVREAEPGMRLAPGRVVLARGGLHLTLRRNPLDGGLLAALAEEPAELLHRPSVDVLFRSAAEVVGAPTLAVVMTGMGRDGLEGARALRAAGARVLAQDEASSVVYGMPRAVVEAGLAEAALPLDAIAPALERAVARPVAA